MATKCKIFFNSEKAQIEMFFGIFSLFLFTFVGFSSAKNVFLSLCDSQFQMLFNSPLFFGFGTEQKTFTAFCQLPNSVAISSLRPFISLESFDDILPNCAKICLACSNMTKPIATFSSDGSSLYFGCLNSDQSSLTVFSVSLPYPSLLVLSLHRNPLIVHPPKVPKFRLFPSIDLRLPSDFFFPFGCE